MKFQESNFGDHIVSKLQDGNYRERIPKNLDPQRTLDADLVLEFLKTSQPYSWKKLQEIHETDLDDFVLDTLSSELDSRGTIDVIRNGLRISDILFDCAYFKPVSTLNKEAQEQYDKNILSYIREAKIDPVKPGLVDILLCVNGLPLATAEIKNLETEQTYRNAEKQYREARDPDAKLLQFKKRTLVHFAIDQHNVSMSTKLDWNKTKFRPFNQGRNDGAGNPDNKPYRTSYLWEKIWQKDIWLDIFKNFIHIETEDPVDALVPTKESVIFPRYHQLDCVLDLVNASKENGPGKNYLVQHSTGSGKSNSIAWLAFKLFSLHNNDNKPVYDSVIVLSDRVGIVGQLQETISQFEQTSGVVEGIKTSQSLADNLKEERKILITTQQKFHNLLDGDKLDTLKGNNFAIIIDEAHSSQGGKSSTKVKMTLSLNEDSQKSETEFEDEDFVDKLEKAMKDRAPKKNLSFYAFTATPRDTTLQLFDMPGKNGKPPFHVYSMNQAIEEGYILDVLKNVITYKRFFEVQKTIPEDKAVEATKAKRAIMQFIDEHEINVEQKSKVIVNHFLKHTIHKILGQAKAMVVTSRRSQALRYKQKIDEYLKELGRDDVKTLVAFSGDLFDETTKEKLNEQKINGTATDEELREEFEKPEFRILIVADKYQTGFNQPKLHTMYVDKKLKDIRAVQTLSRLNRTYDEKHDVFVLLFKNDEEDIKESFDPYYTRTELLDKTSPKYLQELYDLILGKGLVTKDDIDNFVKLWLDDSTRPIDEIEEEKNNIISPIISAYDKLDDVKQDEFRLNLRRFTKNYSFLSQIATYDNPDFEGLFIFGVHLLKFLKGGSHYDYVPEPGDLTLKQYRLIKTGTHSIKLDEEAGELVTQGTVASPQTPEQLAYLSEIIKIINDRNGGYEFTPEDKITADEWREILENIPELREYAQDNDYEYFQNYFEKEFDKVVSRSFDSNPKLVSRYFSDDKLKNEISKKAGELYHKWVQQNNLPPITKTTPALNRMNFRQTIGKCKGYISWTDRYFATDTLKYLMDGMDSENVTEVKLLASIYQSGMNRDLYSQFKNFQEEMKNKGIDCKLRVIVDKDLHYELHDRIIEGENVVYNVPSAKQVDKGQYSEIKKTPNRPPFDNWWNNSGNLDLISDWDKIEKKISEQKSKKMYPAVCSECEKQIQVPFAPDGIRPTYCSEHYHLLGGSS
ncbi:MAG: DEAD/DEAH box helicase family protein [Candidatus Nitrosopumilus sp. bin_68KS]